MVLPKYIQCIQTHSCSNIQFCYSNRVYIHGYINSSSGWKYSDVKVKDTVSAASIRDYGAFITYPCAVLGIGIAWRFPVRETV